MCMSACCVYSEFSKPSDTSLWEQNMIFSIEQPEFRGNSEHLTLLIKAIEKEDVTIWNGWRNDNPEIIPDLSGAYITNVGNLNGINFKNVVLQYASFNKSILMEADFSESDCEGSGFNDSVLKGVNACNAHLSECSFIMADLSNANLAGANLCASTLMHTKLNNAYMTGIKFQNTHLVKCQIDGVVCKQIYIQGTLSPPDRDFTQGELSKLFTEQHCVNEDSVRDFLE